MGNTLRRLDILEACASGNAAATVYDFLQALREDVASAIAGTTLYHKTELDGDGEINADATTLPTALTLVNSLKAHIVTHLASEGIQGVHAAASAEAIAAADATDQSTAETLVNELKADYNTHLSESGVHLQDDTTNTIASADASDLATLLTLVNEIKTDYNLHIASSMSSMRVE